MSEATAATGQGDTTPGGQAPAGNTPAPAPAIANSPAPAPAPVDPKLDGQGQQGQEPQGQGDLDYATLMPEGVELDTATATGFSALAKELNLDPETSKKLVGFYAETAQRQIREVTEMHQAWQQEIAKDPVLSKPEAQAQARQAIEAFGTPELKALLNSTGLGNHPELIRWAHKVGAKISPDTIQTGQPTAPKKSAAEVLYGSTTQS